MDAVTNMQIIQRLFANLQVDYAIKQHFLRIPDYLASRDTGSTDIDQDSGFDPLAKLINLFVG